MSFPVYKNISYYRGTTYPFVVYPKASDGSMFDLTDYDVYFYIGPDRVVESPSDATAGYADKNASTGAISCVITPTVGRTLEPGTTYVYDVTIKNSGTGEISTILTGNITVTGNVEDV